MITKELNENINTVRIDARRRGLEHMTVEHLAFILLKDNSTVREMLVDCSADVNGLKDQFSKYLNTNVQTTPTYGKDPLPTSSFKRVIQRALLMNKKKEEITGLHVLAAIFSEPESPAAYYMKKYGIERLMLLTRISREASQGASFPDAARNNGVAEKDLVALATQGKLEKPSGRQEEISLLIRTLSCKYKNNALLVGDPGVGKTAIVHALAHKVAEGGMPAAMENLRIVPVSVAKLVAGAKYRGDFEQRIQQLVERHRAHGNTVIFIDEIHTLVGAGAVSGSTLDGANILKPLLEESGTRYIGVTTQAEYRRIFEKDRALARRFHKIDVREPDDATLAVIMKRGIAMLSEHHGARYADDAAAAAINVSQRYMPARALPDKALALLDEAGACRQLAPDEAAISGEDIEQIAREAAGLPPLASEEQKTHLAQLEERLNEAVLQQGEAARRLSRAVLAGRLNYREENTVMGAFLFHGPTGVGKTEMARQLAAQLDLPLMRYDMSEYMERHAVSRLIGAPPGYVGYEQSGKLIEDVVQYPSSVLLFDEVEKAHPDVLNILLQILDYGALTDNNGRTADFKGTLVILTSNVGGSDMERAPPGFTHRQEDHLNDEAVQRFFQPEMRNRMDALIRFNPLAPETVASIVDNQLAAIIRRVAKSKGIRLTVGMKLRRQLQKNGYSPTMGARPLQRLIREQVLERLALAEAKGKVSPGGKYHIEENRIIERPSSRGAKDAKGGKDAKGDKERNKITIAV